MKQKPKEETNLCILAHFVDVLVFINTDRNVHKDNHEITDTFFLVDWQT